MSVEPPVNFSTFIISLASSALAHMGETENMPLMPVDLGMAKHTMDVIELLAEKTKGNLDEEETKLLDAVQRELSERYAARVAAARK